MESPVLEVDLTSLEVEPATEAEHLRRLLDKQPSCLMRVGADGEVLAANEASLRLLGVESLTDALGKPFSAWLPPEQHPQWAAFSAQVVGGSPASIECDIQAATGEGRVARFHGVSITDHPDGITSMVLSARDAMDRRRLERSLNEMAAERERMVAESEAERAKVRQGLEALRAQYQGELQRATGEAALRQAEASREEHDAVLRGLESQRLDLQAQLDHAFADRHRVESALADAEARLQHAAVEREADRGRFERSLDSMVERHESELREAGTAIGQLTAEKSALQQKLDHAEGHSVELAAALCDAEARHQQAVEALARDAELARLALQTRLDEAVTDCRRLEEAVRRHAEASQEEHDAVLRGLESQRLDLQAQLDQAIADRQRAESALADAEARLQQVAVERHESELREAETALGQLTAEKNALQQKLDLAEGHRLELAAALREEHDAVLRGLESQRLDLQARLDQAIADRQRAESALADTEARLQQVAVERHESELREARDAAEQAGAHQDAAGSGAGHDAGEREQFWAAIEQAGTALGQLTAEKDALQQKLDHAEGHRLELAAALRDAEARHQQVVAALAQDAEFARVALEARLDETVMDCRRLEAAVMARDTGSAQAPGVTAAAAAGAGQGALASTAADQAVALHALADQVRRLSPLAAAGRVGREIASELQCLVRGADAASTRLLSACPIDHPHRADVERLRADTIQAAALAGELLLATLSPDDSEWTPRGATFPVRRV